MPPVVAGLDVSNIALPGSPRSALKYDLLLGEGVVGSPFGPFEGHFGTSWTEAASVSPRELLRDVIDALADVLLPLFL